MEQGDIGDIEMTVPRVPEGESSIFHEGQSSSVSVMFTRHLSQRGKSTARLNLIFLYICFAVSEETEPTDN